MENDLHDLGVRAVVIPRKGDLARTSTGPDLDRTRVLAHNLVKIAALIS